MSFSIGIVGLPNVGKSTLFKAITKKKVNIDKYPFTTIHPNYGTVSVPDERLEKIAKLFKPEKVTPTVIEFIDIAGLIKDAHKGQGLGNQFLSHIRNCDAILEVIRVFEAPGVENVLEEINPEKEIEIIKTELLMKDLETLERLLEKIEKDAKKNKKSQKKLELLKRIKDDISQGKSILEMNLNDDEKTEIKEYLFLSQKPILYLLNTDGKTKYLIPNVEHLAMNFKYEEEISEFSADEKKEIGIKPQIDQLILASYNILDLITFFTVAGGKEIRAWTLKRGSKAPEAGGVVHSDFQKKFIRAEVISWKKLIETDSWKKAKESGWLKIVGKDYIVEDGDVIEFKI